MNPFTDKQIELVTTFADQAVIAIENVRLFERSSSARASYESLEQQTATSKVLEVISRSAFDLHAVFETVAESSVRLCGADRGYHLPFRWRAAADGGRPTTLLQELKEFVEQNPIRPRPAQFCCPRRIRNAERFTFPMSWLIPNIRMGRKTSMRSGQFSVSDPQRR